MIRVAKVEAVEIDRGRIGLRRAGRRGARLSRRLADGEQG
jgi:hypothetical protein